MTKFEELAKELNVKIETNARGLYTGMCSALASITTEVIISDDEAIFNLPWQNQKDIIIKRFYEVFPYMKA